MDNPSTAWRRLQAGHHRAAALRPHRPGSAAGRSPVAVVFRCADSDSPPLLAPACPNCTSDLNSLAQVPLQG